MCFLRGGERSPRTYQFAFEFADAFGSGVEFRAECCDFLVGFLELEEERNRGMHEGSLAQRMDAVRLR